MAIHATVVGFVRDYYGEVGKAWTLELAYWRPRLHAEEDRRSIPEQRISLSWQGSRADNAGRVLPNGRQVAVRGVLWEGPNGIVGKIDDIELIGPAPEPKPIESPENKAPGKAEKKQKPKKDKTAERLTAE